MMAVVFGNTDVVKFLVKSGADLELRDRWNMTALDWAIWFNQTEIEHVLRNGTITQLYEENVEEGGEESDKENSEENNCWF